MKLKLQKLKNINLLKTGLRLILAAFCVLIVISLQAQSLSDIQNLKVDDLSDSQIEQLIKRAEANGLTPNQLENLARERGMPASEAAKLRERISSLQGSLGNKPGELRTGPDGTRSYTDEQGINMFDSIRRADPYYDLTPKQKKIFGFKLFHNRELNFSPSLNLPTPESYVVGPGDQLLIDVYGASQQAYDLTVTPEGRIFVPNVGPVQVGGATIGAALARLKSSMSRIYSGMSGPNPNTFLQVRLGNIRSIKVSMVGELTKPGTYVLPSFATVFNALYAAGGPNENGAFRNVQVYRNNRLISTVDIYDFLSKGDQSSNITLQDNDVIIVPPVQARVEIVGPVRREGLFEVKQGEHLEDLYVFTAGFSSQAYTDRVTVRRILNNQRKVIDVPSDQFNTFELRDGDEILIGEVLDRFSNRVQVTGSVNRPGEYSFEDGDLTVKGLVEKAQGLKPEAFVNRATLYRTSDDLTLAAESLDLKGILDGTRPDITLKNEDLLFIPSRYDIQEAYYVKISGEVGAPGTYPYAADMTVGDLILRAGGLLESATNSSIEIARRVRDANSGKLAEISTLTIDSNLELSEGEKLEKLRAFDHVFIRRSPGFEREQIVKVTGEVVYPGDFAMANANERISDVINRAGGLSPFAYPKGASLIRRTAYYKDLTPEEMSEAMMKEIRDNLDPKKNRNQNEAEAILYQRLNQRLETIEEERKKVERDKVRENIFQFDSDRDSLKRDSALYQIRYKEKDMIGIDLEYILKNPGSEADLILFEGDVIQIPKQLQTVRMVGEVLLPTTARYIPSMGLRSYISKAGGFTENARRSKSYVIYANGDAKRTHSLLGLKFYPKLEPGAEIIVPQKPERPPIGPQQWVAIGTGLATFGLVVVQIFNFLNTP